MTKPLIGYHSKKKRKWPQFIIFVFIIMIAVLTIFLLKPDFNNLKNFYASYDKNKSKEIPELNNPNDIIKANNTPENISYFDEKLETNEQNEENPVIVEEIKEKLDNSSEQKLKSSLKTIEDKDSDNHYSANISDEKKYAETDSNTIKKEKVYIETENLRSVSNKLEEESKSAEDTFELKIDKYYIIISSVDSKEAADKQQQKFLNMSVKTDVIYVPSNNRYRLSLGTYSNFKEASAKSKAFQSKYPAYKTWVWKVQ